MPELVLDDVTLAYEQSGAGPDILWLAAGDNPGSNWRRYQTPAFEPRLPQHDLRRARRGRDRVAHRRRRGRSRCTRRMPPPSIEAVCDGPAFLVGLSMGSLIAVQLAHDRPDLVRAAVVMGTCVRKTGLHPRVGGGGDRPAPRRRRAAARVRDRPLRDAVLPRRGARRRRAVGAHQAVRGERLRGARRRDARGAVAGVPGLRLDRRCCPNVRVPVHAVAFSEDVQTPPRAGARGRRAGRGRPLPPAATASATARRSATGPTTSTTASGRSWTPSRGGRPLHRPRLPDGALRGGPGG